MVQVAANGHKRGVVTRSRPIASPTEAIGCPQRLVSRDAEIPKLVIGEIQELVTHSSALMDRSEESQAPGEQSPCHRLNAGLRAMARADCVEHCHGKVSSFRGSIGLSLL